MIIAHPVYFMYLLIREMEKRRSAFSFLDSKAEFLILSQAVY